MREVKPVTLQDIVDLSDELTLRDRAAELTVDLFRGAQLYPSADELRETFNVFLGLLKPQPTEDPNQQSLFPVGD